VLYTVPGLLRYIKTLCLAPFVVCLYHIFINRLAQGRTNPGRHVAMAPRNIVVAPGISGSNYNWFMNVVAILTFPAPTWRLNFWAVS
jgi:hypothetical protein